MTEVVRPMVEQFFSTARERYQIMRFREQGLNKPWTQDPVFQQWRFCNVHREDDKTTQWFRDNVRSKLSCRKNFSGPDLIMATLAFRWFNRIETGELLLDLLLGKWNKEIAAARLGRVKGPVVTGAYMVRTEAGVLKWEGLLNYIEAAEIIVRGREWGANWQDPQMTLYSAHEVLSQLWGMGRFTSYEVVTDLRHTRLLMDAPDVNTWASAGPGCARGLGWVFDGDPERFKYTSTSDQSHMNTLMQELLTMSRSVLYWPSSWDKWEMREVEHWACEFDKYQRASGGERLKRRFP